MDWTKLLPFATERQREYLRLRMRLPSNTAVAEALGIDRRAVDRGLRSAETKALEAGAIAPLNEDQRLLFLDIETAPLLGYLWSLWKDYTGPSQLEQDRYIISFAYKWQGDKVDDIKVRTLPDTDQYATDRNDDSGLVAELWRLMDHADIIVAHNGDKFDIKKIKSRMVQNGMGPPAPFRTVDTLKICKREFGFTSNRLDFLGSSLLGTPKHKTDFELWRGCLENRPEAWEEMAYYNACDIEILEGVYNKIRAWDRSHPNLMIAAEGPHCTVCGSEDLVQVPDRTVATASAVYSLVRCNTCGHNMRGAQNLRSKHSMQTRLMNAR